MGFAVAYALRHVEIDSHATVTACVLNAMQLKLFSLVNPKRTDFGNEHLFNLMKSQLSVLNISRRNLFDRFRHE